MKYVWNKGPGGAQRWGWATQRLSKATEHPGSSLPPFSPPEQVSSGAPSLGRSPHDGQTAVAAPKNACAPEHPEWEVLGSG